MYQMAHNINQWDGVTTGTKSVMSYVANNDNLLDGVTTGTKSVMY